MKAGLTQREGILTERPEREPRLNEGRNLWGDKPDRGKGQRRLQERWA